MSNIKEALEENIKMIDDMIAGSQAGMLNTLQLRVMKWNMTRALNAVVQLERILAAKKQSTKQNTK